MAGLKIVLPTTFTDSTLPVLRDDPLLVSGSLVLLEPAHSARAFPAIPVQPTGVETVATVPNIAWREAAATIGGSPSQSSLDCFLHLNAGFTAPRGKIERSTLGGLHGIVSQTQISGSAQGATLDLPDIIREYVRANPNNDLYLSLWQRVTRAPLALASGAVYPLISGIVSSSTPSSNYAALFTANTVLPPTGVNRLGGRSDPFPLRTTPGTGSVGPQFRGLATGAWTGTVPGSVSSVLASLAAWGQAARTGFDGGAGTYPAHSSHIVYRVYLEDLTVSGRSHATVDAQDFAMYTAQVLTAGGKYFGDTTPTDPSTVA